MFPSVMTDELGIDFAEALPILELWGLRHCDLRGRIFGRSLEALSAEQLVQVKKRLGQYGMKVGCLQSSVGKVHLPGPERHQAEAEKFEAVVRAADVLDCRLVRAFFFWQPPRELRGELAVRPDELQKVLDAFGPLADRARAAGLILAFENCNVTPNEIFAVLDSLGAPSWGLAWDVYNNWNCDERLADAGAFIIRMAQRARLVHVKARGALRDFSEDLIPYDLVLQTCHNAGVQGPVTVETHNPDPSVDHTDMTRRVYEVVQRAWPTAAPGPLFDTQTQIVGVSRPWDDEPVGFVVVGLGMGHSRSKLITKTPGARLVGVCDIVEERATRTGGECAVPYTTDIRPWLDNSQVEAVFVLTETGRHAEVGLQAVEAGKHVLVTKPMDASLGACDELIRAAEAKGVLLGVDFSRRFEADTLGLKAAVDKGRFGRLLSGQASLKILRAMDYYRANGAWRGTRRWDGGGVLSNQSIHHIDELAFCIGIPAKVGCAIWTQDHDIEAEDLACATWLYDNGLVLTYYATSSYPHATWYYSVELHGTEGAMARAAGGPFDRSRERWFIDGAWSFTMPDSVQPEWLNAVDNFAAAIRTGAELVCPGRDGRRTQAILDAMYRSAYDADGAWVDVQPELEAPDQGPQGTA